MSAVPIVLIGTIKDSNSEEEKQVTITGLASIAGLRVGGGPSDPPLTIWGPNPGFPTNPIAGIPGLPGYQPPPIIWGPPGPWPTPPIAGIPGLPGYQPPGGGGGGGGGGGDHQPKFEAKVAWSVETGWVVVFVPLEGTLVPTPSAAS